MKKALMIHDFVIDIPLILITKLWQESIMSNSSKLVDFISRVQINPTQLKQLSISLHESK